MRIMRVVELNLLTEKEKIEYALEETLNDKDLEVDKKINKVMELLKKQTENLGSIQLWSQYIAGLTDNNNEKKE